MTGPRGDAANAARVPAPPDLVGVWTLAAFHDVEADGERSEGPLGPEPRGLLIYTADGHVSVHMMRVTGTASAPGARDYMGYGGTWRIEDGRIVHTIRVTPTRPWIDTEQIRVAEPDGRDRLTLHGSARVGDAERRRVLEWRRQTGGPGS
ncbi:hypothetical protein BTM25_50320 [Actinomadura rubteroloni]|uniref:Lipocalin-like domain-containing protein n=1 Tax=Actinomadura rubteroloni TaxID=1926885 RepID=A0A2P4UCR2_9ACTN|nr:lipocalin-like domain-containing protein [Actinomadura rubteroloni]POM22827.1 hypothetical protein BTM25_50320 [Actinomadura rubteroloni]